MNIKNRKKLIIIISFIIIGIILIGIGSYFTYYKHMQSKINIRLEKTFGIKTNEETNIEVIARKWVEGYTAQFQQKYIERYKGLENVKIGRVTILDEARNIVEVDFTAQLKQRKSTYFTDWNGELNSNDELKFEWVLTLNPEDNLLDEKMAYVIDRQTPKAYMITLDGKNSQKNIEKEKCIYRIRDKKVYVSYSADKAWENSNWKEVPISLDYLDTYNSGSNLEDYIYQISSEKTAFIYTNGLNETSKLMITFSDDEGMTWKNVVVDKKLIGTSPVGMYVHFTNKEEGHILVGYGDIAMGVMQSLILKTTDGGITWQEVSSGPSDVVAVGSSAIFFNESLGFISSAKGGSLQITEDGGKTFKAVELPEQTLEEVYGVKYTWSRVYTMPQLPKLEDGIMTLIVKQASDQDYKGGNFVAKYQSKDMGKTWEYVEQYKLEE